MQRLPDRLRWDDEGRRSVARRGVLGHYVSGLYRTAARPVATRQIVLRARLRALLWGYDEVANLVERLPARYINPVLRAFGATIAPTATLLEGLRLATVHDSGFANLTIGQHVHISHHMLIDLSNSVILGDFVTAGNNISLVSHIDVGHSPLKAQLYPVASAPIKIGRGVYIGSNTLITHGVTVGECAVVGGNSLVLDDIPPFSLAAGSPARVIRELDRDKLPPFDDNRAFIIPEGTRD